ncbi:hypothetical protein [Pseudoxanthomonas putridarboris]|uniref:Uncharacterized protein n=1 Tax=Pseudoxanthomonas putridarboris TaxID=752605 RepID=A0ABU9J5D1_9GAMM
MAPHLPCPGLARAGSLAIWRRIGVSMAGALAVCLMLLAGMPADTSPTAIGYSESSTRDTPQSPARNGLPDEAKLRRLVRMPTAPKADILRTAASVVRASDVAALPPHRLGSPRFAARPPSDPPRQTQRSRAPPHRFAG